jgi:hypothetical protein
MFYAVAFDALQNLFNAIAFQKEKREVSFYREKNNSLGFQMETETIRIDFEQKKIQGLFFPPRVYFDFSRENPGE